MSWPYLIPTHSSALLRAFVDSREDSFLFSPGGRPTKTKAGPRIARIRTHGEGPNGSPGRVSEGYALSANLLLWYDGQEFGRFEMPLEHLRVMTFGAEGEIYIGGTDDIGVVRADDSSGFSYRSLLDGVPAEQRKFGVIWEAAISGGDS